MASSIHPYTGIHMAEDDGISPIWVDKEQKEYYCECEISDTHLVNIINFIMRQPPPPYPMLGGDMAQYAAEQEWDQMVGAVNIMLGEMTGIAKARGIKV